MVAAIEDLCRELPNGIDEYLEEVRSFILRIYSKAGGSKAKYFLDKTPRYDLVAEDVVRLFPEGKFIFLWRNPLAVIASIMETWAGGKWNLYGCKVDLFDGLTNLVAAYQKHKDQVCAVKYENLLLNPEKEWERVFDYLDLPFDPRLLSRFDKVRLKGRMDDSREARPYQVLSREPLEKWKVTLANPIRKSWCRRYLHWIGSERLEVMGYSLNDLLAELDDIPTTARMVGSDIVRINYGYIYEWLEPIILKDKLKLLPQNWRVHGHQ